MRKIAVYGTLRAGHGNHHYVENSTLIGIGWTDDKHTMYASGIPYVHENGGTSQIRCEVYEVSDEDMPDVDSLEGHPGWYNRRPTAVTLDNGDKVEAEMYFMEVNRPIFIVESGDYFDYSPPRIAMY